MKWSEATKQNLSRLLESPKKENQDLALQIIEGLKLTEEDSAWLWEKYLSLQSHQQSYTIRHYPFLDDVEILKGKILGHLLDYAPRNVQEKILGHFQKENTIRLPYTTHTILPNCLFDTAWMLEEITWQDGELQSIDENIIQFPNLRKLDFRRQPIEYISPRIAEMESLESIHLVSASFIPPELAESQDIEIIIDAPY